MIQSQVPSALSWVGEDNYTFAQAVDECMSMGVSRRINLKGIPEGFVPGVSKIFLVHPKAIIRVAFGSLWELLYDLMLLGYISTRAWEDLIANEYEDKLPYTARLEPYDFVPKDAGLAAYYVSKVTPAEYKYLDDKYKFTFSPGVFGYAPFGEFQYVLKPGESDLPKELQHLEGYVEPVKVLYDDDEDNNEDYSY